MLEPGAVLLYGCMWLLSVYLQVGMYHKRNNLGTVLDSLVRKEQKTNIIYTSRK